MPRAHAKSSFPLDLLDFLDPDPDFESFHSRDQSRFAIELRALLLDAPTTGFISSVSHLTTTRLDV